MKLNVFRQVELPSVRPDDVLCGKWPCRCLQSSRVCISALSWGT